MFIARHHRHAKPPSVCITQVGVALEDKLVGVAMLSRPLSRHLCDGYTAEVSRVCTDGAENAASMLYGAMCRAAFALGYRRVITYTLESELGSSLRASGFREDGLRTHAVDGWKRQQGGARSEVYDLFRTLNVPAEVKRRWVRALGEPAQGGKG